MSATSTRHAVKPAYVDAQQLTLDGGCAGALMTRASGVSTAVARPITVAGRRLTPTAVFDTYWRFAAERQAVYEARMRDLPKPWTGDPVLSAHRFTNCFRAADRVSQYLISRVLYEGPQDPINLVFRGLLFKLFNKIETWELICRELGEVKWEEYDYRRFDRILGSALSRGERLYSAAYVMPPPRLGETRKHSNHLRLIELMMANRLPDKVVDSGSLSVLYSTLKDFPAMGPFLAFQFAIDLNYSSIVDHSESEFVVAGPGARDGIEKCFGRASRGIEGEIIRYMSEHQDEHFSRLGLTFRGLAGHRPLQLIDCQNLFCEVDKYARVVHPDVLGLSGRTRIKQRYRPAGRPRAAWFPPRWGLNRV